MCLGHGLLNTIIGIRATLETFPNWFIGVMTSGYYIGFVIGTLLCARLIFIVGHIRSFSVFASLASVMTLGLTLLVNPVNWLLMRAIYGICIAALYMIIESWLNSIARNEERGRILSVYMIISYLGLAGGQLFVFLSGPEDYTLFAIASILLSLSLIPLSASKRAQPEKIDAGKFEPSVLFKTSPLAAFGCFCTGLILGAFWGFGPVFLAQLGLNSTDVALFIGGTFLGGLCLQWPIGTLSDRLDRRWVIGFICFCSTVTSALILLHVHRAVLDMTPKLFVLAMMFGGTNYSLYSLFISLINDFLTPENRIQASGGLLALHALGAVIGPVCVPVVAHFAGPAGFLFFTASVAGAMVVLALVQAVRGRRIPEATSEGFVSVPRTGIGVLSLDPRQEDSAP